MKPRTHNEAMERILKEAYALRLRKHHDYGGDPIRFLGLEGIMVRCFDKLFRIKNLLKKQALVAESMRDSWLDNLNYSLIAIMVIDGTFDLPIEDELDGGFATTKHELEPSMKTLERLSLDAFLRDNPHIQDAIKHQAITQVGLEFATKHVEPTYE
jgi:hypothetical protein